MIVLKRHVKALHTNRHWLEVPTTFVFSLCVLCVRVKKREHRAPGRDALPPSDHLPGPQQGADYVTTSLRGGVTQNVYTHTHTHSHTPKASQKTNLLHNPIFVPCNIIILNCTVLMCGRAFHWLPLLHHQTEAILRRSDRAKDQSVGAESRVGADPG